MDADAAVLEILRALSRHAIEHCPHRTAAGDRWIRAPGREWQVVPLPCEACDALAAALGLEGHPPRPGRRWPIRTISACPTCNEML